MLPSRLSDGALDYFAARHGRQPFVGQWGYGGRGAVGGEIGVIVYAPMLVLLLVDAPMGSIVLPASLARRESVAPERLGSTAASAGWRCLAAESVKPPGFLGLSAAYSHTVPSTNPGGSTCTVMCAPPNWVSTTARTGGSTSAGPRSLTTWAVNISCPRASVQM